MDSVTTGEPPTGGLALMALDDVAPRNCTIADSLAILGERWTLLAIREMVYGAHRFDQIVGFTGVSRDILSDRLRKLEQHGVVERRQYLDHPVRYEYHLTEAGQDLAPVLMALANWGAKWAPNPDSTRSFVHDCGHPPALVWSCEACGRAVTPENVTPLPVA